MKPQQLILSSLASSAMALTTGLRERSPLSAAFIGPRAPVPAALSEAETLARGLEARQNSASCFPMTIVPTGGSDTVSYGLANVTAAVHATAQLCQQTTCTGSATVKSLEGDGFTEWDVVVSADGEFTSPAVRDLLLTALYAMSTVGVTTATDKGNVVFTGPSSFAAQLQDSCGGVANWIKITVAAGSPAAGACGSWVGIVTDVIWDFLNVIRPGLFGGIVAGVAAAACSG